MNHGIHEKTRKNGLFSVPFRVFRGLILPKVHRSYRAEFGNFRINRSLLTIFANQPSIVLVRAARRRYRLYHQQSVKRLL